MNEKKEGKKEGNVSGISNADVGKQLALFSLLSRT